MFVAVLKEEQNRICDMKLKSERGSRLLTVSDGLKKWNQASFEYEVFAKQALHFSDVEAFFLPLEWRPKVKQISRIKLEVT